ncbi:MAG: radical SAM family heme chaperone HemW [Defluviitaleaceae bacterium]|nr:radical SAM family heme chaperone HemW [Defluviitaleaceae bacterium]
MIYIHIPFCKSKCAYCDFLSSAANPSPDGYAMAEGYTKALLNELKTACEGDMKGRAIKTIYVGGGTPTALPLPFLCAIINGAKRFNLTNDAEITVECNPGTLGTEGYAALKSVGVNRLSIGLQAFLDPLLARIGRSHTVEDFMLTFRAAREVGFENINVDLMFSLPGQTMNDWRDALEKLVALRPEHISAYSLTPAEGTPLWEGLEEGGIVLPDDETDRAMYHEANRTLAAAGYRRYEISNYALPGRESRHNVNTWKRLPYRGFGLGAHSFELDGGGGVRWYNTEDMEKYLRAQSPPYAPCREGYTPIEAEEAMAEAMILGLRLTDGVVLQQNMQDRYGIKIEGLIADGLLAREKDRIYLTGLGTDLANRVFGAFI